MKIGRCGTFCARSLGCLPQTARKLGGSGRNRDDFVESDRWTVVSTARDQYCWVGRLPFCRTRLVGAALAASPVVFGFEEAAVVRLPFEDCEVDGSLVLGAWLLAAAFSPASRFWARGVAVDCASDESRLFRIRPRP